MTTNGNTIFDSFIWNLSSRSALGSGSRANGFCIGSYRGERNDGPEMISQQHILAMCKDVARFETSDCRNNTVVHTKGPGALCLVPAGIRPLIRAQTGFELVVCALDPVFVKDVETEMEHRPGGELHLQANIYDDAVLHLLRMLQAHASEGYPSGKIYADYLAHALVTRFLFLGKRMTSTEGLRSTSALPRHVLRRVVDLMNDLGNDLSLQTLARESGYSRGHFVRMFQKNTGQTPHRYLLQLRIERAKELMRNRSISLTDIALSCGFSSHSHMTHAFRKFLGATPSEWRCNLSVPSVSKIRASARPDME